MSSFLRSLLLLSPWVGVEAGQFVPFDAPCLITNGAADIEAFQMGGHQWVALANHYGGNVKVYRWDPTDRVFDIFQIIETKFPTDAEVFHMGGFVYLAVATYGSPSVIYKSDGVGPFSSEFEFLENDQTIDWEFFVRNGDPHLAMANQKDSRMFYYTGKTFRQSKLWPNTLSATDFEYFYVDGTPYLALCDDDHVKIYNINPNDPNGYQQVDSIYSPSAHDSHHFVLNGDLFLVVGKTKGAVDASLYKWEVDEETKKGTFVLHQSMVPTDGPTFSFSTFMDLKYNFYLVAANRNDDEYAFYGLQPGDPKLDSLNDFDEFSSVLRWDSEYVDSNTGKKGGFVKHQVIPTRGAADVEIFLVSPQELILAFANVGRLTSEGPRPIQATTFYIWHPYCDVEDQICTWTTKEMCGEERNKMQLEEEQQTLDENGRVVLAKYLSRKEQIRRAQSALPWWGVILVVVFCLLVIFLLFLLLKRLKCLPFSGFSGKLAYREHNDEPLPSSQGGTVQVTRGGAPMRIGSTENNAV